MPNKHPRELEGHLTQSKPTYSHEEDMIEDAEEGIHESIFKSRRTWLVLTAFVLMFIILQVFSPDVTGMVTKNGKALDPQLVVTGMAIFVCIAFLWLTEALPVPITAILVPVLVALFSVSTLQENIASFANPTIYIFFGGFAIASALSYQGIDRWIANRILLISKGKMLTASILLFCATAFLSMWISNTATAAMMLPLVIGIIGQLTIKDEKTKINTQVFLLLGVAYSASVGGIGTLVGSPPNGIAAQTLGIGFQEWLKFGIPTVLVMLPTMILILMFVLKPSLKDTVEIKKEHFEWTAARITTLAIFALTATCWIFSTQISKLLGGIKSFDSVVALSAAVLLVFVRVVRWKDIDKGTDWGVLMLFGGGLALSAMLGKTGLSIYLAQSFSSAISAWSLIMIIGAITLLVLVLTEFSSNTATAAVFVPVFYAVALEMGIDPVKLVIPLAIASSCAFMLPVATPPNAIVYGTGKVPQKMMLRSGIVLNVASVFILTLLASFVF